jgi:hypothetical protein
VVGWVLFGCWFGLCLGGGRSKHVSLDDGQHFVPVGGIEWPAVETAATSAKSVLLRRISGKTSEIVAGEKHPTLSATNIGKMHRCCCLGEPLVPAVHLVNEQMGGS